MKDRRREFGEKREETIKSTASDGLCRFLSIPDIHILGAVCGQCNFSIVSVYFYLAAYS